MPQRHPATETFCDISKSIDGAIDTGINPIRLSKILFKIASKNKFYYWYELNEHVSLCSELEILDKSYAIKLTGKNIKNKGSRPYASDLYKDILNDIPDEFNLMSDCYLSDNGHSIWKRLVEMDCNVSVYNCKNPMEKYAIFNSVNDMENYFGDNTKFVDYRFTLIKI